MTKEQAIILASILLLNILWSVIKLLFELKDNIADYFAPNHYNDQKWVQNAPYTTIVNECILYTNDILYNHGIDHFPSYRIYYYKHRKHLGVYDGEIVIYTKNNENIAELRTPFCTN